MAVHFTIPGKTFFLGEYLALQGGPALVGLTQPCFEFFGQVGKGQLEGIHPESPAGKFITSKKDFFQNYDITFKDPYEGRGGFGASTAQFLGAYSLWLHKDVHQHEMQQLFDFRHLLETYHQVAWNGKGFAPSGADLVGQLKGAFTFFEKRHSFISVSGWPFSDLEFYLLHTGNKMATHDHLANLLPFDSAGLEKSFALAKTAFESKQSSLFVDAIRSYGKELSNLGLTCEKTLKLLQDIQVLPGVLAAKGCGAMGSDVVLTLTAHGKGQALQQYCQENGLKIMATHQELSQGLQMDVKENK